MRAPTSREQARTDPGEPGRGPHRVPRSTVEKVLASPAEALDEGAAAALGPGFAHSFGRVRIHRDAAAAESASTLGAAAYTWGNDVVFGPGTYEPDTARGRDLLRHELAHVGQMVGVSAPLPSVVEVSPSDARAEREADAFARGTGLPPQTGFASAQARVHRKIVPEDVASEMVGRQMTVESAFTATPATTASGPFSVPASAVVEVVKWDNALPTARVQLVGAGAVKNKHIPFDIPKTLLRPIAPASKLAPYRSGVAGQAAAVEKGAAAIAAEKARKGGPRPGEVPRLEGLQKTRREVLNKRLIQETMFNRFDPSIEKWVAHYNAKFPHTPPLDPNLVKSMLFQESQIGTSGEHLEVPPTHPTKTRFNLGQVIDSSALALLVMMDEMEPGLLTKHSLQNIKTDLAAAQSELKALKAKKTRTAAEEARLKTLTGLSKQSWEVFLWAYKAPGKTTGFAAAAADFFKAPSGGIARNFDYDFWIRAAVRWLFEKRKTVKSWAEAIRAYNGSGARAEHYRDAVLKRSGSATAAQKAGKDFVPDKI